MVTIDKFETIVMKHCFITYLPPLSVNFEIGIDLFFVCMLSDDVISDVQLFTTNHNSTLIWPIIKNSKDYLL